MRIASIRPHLCLYEIPDASFDFVRFKTDPDPGALVNQNQLWAWNVSPTLSAFSADRPNIEMFSLSTI